MTRAAHRVRVVVVDDVPAARHFVRAVLEETGHFVIVAEATDGLDALRAVAHHQPDVITLDLAMPGASGTDILPALRALVPTARVVVLSGFPVPRAERVATGRGADAYLQKGLSPDELAEAVSLAAGLTPQRPPGSAS